MPSIFPACIRGRPGSGHEPGNVTAEAGRLRFSPPGRGRTWLPGASAPCLDITLSDVVEQGKRAHSRRYERLSTADLPGVVAAHNGKSVVSIPSVP